MKTANENLTVGPVAAGLLRSLRALESAHNYYFTAFDAMGGEAAATAADSSAAPLFDAVRDVIERALAGVVRTWAANDPETSEI